MSDTTTITLNDSVVAEASVMVGSATTMTSRMAHGVPLSIPRDQLYYWSMSWQDDIRESMEALRAGEYVDFESDDPSDIVRWFLDDED